MAFFQQTNEVTVHWSQNGGNDDFVLLKFELLLLGGGPNINGNGVGTGVSG
jgi:hypothetical protein